MTVSSEINKWSYAGDDLQVVFPYVARIYEASDLLVYLRDGEGAESLQVLDVDYTVDGVLEEGGGNVTFVAAPATGETVVIKIELPYIQELALPEAGLLPTGPMEIAMDRAVKLILQLRERLDRTFTLSPTCALTGLTVSDPEPGKYLIGNAAGDGYDNAEIAEGTLVTTGMDVAGFVKNTAAGVLEGGQSIVADDLPAATEIAQGAAELATEAECITGTDDSRAVTPAGMKAAIDDRGFLTEAPIISAMLQNRRTQNTSGGTATTGSWGIVALNTEYEDDYSIVDASALPAFTLEAGIYQIRAFLPFAAGCQQGQCRLYNITDGAVQQNVSGHEMYSTSQAVAAYDPYTLTLIGTINLDGPKQLRIEYNVAQTVSTSGQGLATNYGPEVYAQVQIVKVA